MVGLTEHTQNRVEGPGRPTAGRGSGTPVGRPSGTPCGDATSTVLNQLAHGKGESKTRDVQYRQLDNISRH